MTQSFSESFVNYLQSMKDDRGKLAVLRKGLNANQAHASWPLLAPFLDFDKPYLVKTLQTVGGLYAYHVHHVEGVNVGKLCRGLLDEEEKQKLTSGESGPISRNFQYVLAADGEEVFARVKRLVFRAKQDGVGLDYVCLLDDLRAWNDYRKEKVKLNWGKEFWKITNTEANESMESNNDSSD